MKSSTDLKNKLKSGGYEGYAYAYPHKTSYRTFESPKPLKELWQRELKDELFLYIHLPFCEYRCGFCNLLTTANPAESLVDKYLKSLKLQSKVVHDCIRPEKVSQVAIGGGTPSYLSPGELEDLFNTLESDWPLSVTDVPLSFEVSPGTVDKDRLKVLKDRGVQRVSMGIQSFSQRELKALGRPQKVSEVMQASDLIRESDFPVFNIDLIYGTALQTRESWLQSLNQAMQWSPQEVYLYPLYVRDLTGLGRRGDSPSEKRMALYQTGRDVLLSNGYEQVSMRYFRRPNAASSDADWCCQEDGMIGLGAGARSYTKRAHYSTEYAVGIASVRDIIKSYCEQTADTFSHAHYGVQLNTEEQRRRYVIKSLLRIEGLNTQQYYEQFESYPEKDLPQLTELIQLELASVDTHALRLTPKGIAHSDTIGPWLYSTAVQSQMDHYEFT